MRDATVEITRRQGIELILGKDTSDKRKADELESFFAEKTIDVLKKWSNVETEMGPGWIPKIKKSAQLAVKEDAGPDFGKETEDPGI